MPDYSTLSLLLLALVLSTETSVVAFQPAAGLASSTPASTSALFSSSSETETNTKKRSKAVVVGGGPVGLATALTLSNAPHYYDVTVLEAAPKASGYDPTKAYLYLVNPRGQDFTKKFSSVQKKLKERSSENSGMGNFVLVPADPSLPVPDKIPAANGTEPSYWIPRHSMVTLLEEAIEEQEASKTSEQGSVTVLPCQACQTLHALDDGRVEVMALDTKDASARFERSFVADLVVGADGMNSAVRQCLEHPSSSSKSNWLSENPKKFRQHSWASAASGLRMKVLQFPPSFVIPTSSGNIVTESETTYAIRGKNTGPNDYVSLGLLPVKDPNMVRPTNVITRPGHEVWKLRTGKDAKKWFCRAFPRLQLEQMIDDQEWDRFAKAEGTTFPRTTYCAGMQCCSPGGKTGVVLVGDAIHSFPPDIGQGINAGLADVVALDRALKDDEHNLATALQNFEQSRTPEVKALIRLSRFGSPYQYRQPQYRDRIGRQLWATNVAFRLLLNKISFGLIPAACIMNAMNKKMSYRKLMRRSDMTSTAIWTILAVVARKVGFGNGGMVALGVLSFGLWYTAYWFG